MTNADLLLRALHHSDEPPLRPLPKSVAALLRALDAPPRLAAHLRAVHDVAHQLVDWVELRHPTLPFDREAALFGAATHDVGKTRYVAELTGPGSQHEEAGRELLLAHGISAKLARFAATHASWSGPGIGIEGLLVSVADKIWKNKRVPDLEDLLVKRLAEASGRPVWEEFMEFDEVLARIGEDAEARLDFQASYPVHG
ncbi:HD domain-containing protein [Streptomyces sp. V1I1]|uniref:HD domain-containing protein n=1 Tax=Streptomyces sp. V1I1 TaxID=3042272 RepID=UPI0027D79CE6|nr:HD domain-containing protein [Streptomyces sp. V1I1]